MSPKYQQSRPSIPADIRRAVEVESGHACAVSRCGEHTYLEIHHINRNREDNQVENLILLCDKHHKMAHNDVIDQKALRDYKKLLKSSYDRDVIERIRRLEELAEKEPESKQEREGISAVSAPDPDLPIKQVEPRHQTMARTLEQLAISRFERDHNLLLERSVRFSKGTARFEIDAIRQDDDLPEDLIVEVSWIRKPYLDSAAFVQRVDARIEVYELVTGRKARGVLILVVAKETMKDPATLPSITSAVQQNARQLQLIFYSYQDLGFDPGPVSAAIFASNLRPPKS